MLGDLLQQLDQVPTVSAGRKFCGFFGREKGKGVILKYPNALYSSKDRRKVADLTDWGCYLGLTELGERRYQTPVPAFHVRNRNRPIQAVFNFSVPPNG